MMVLLSVWDFRCRALSSHGIIGLHRISFHTFIPPSSVCRNYKVLYVYLIVCRSSHKNYVVLCAYTFNLHEGIVLMVFFYFFHSVMFLIYCHVAVLLIQEWTPTLPLMPMQITGFNACYFIGVYIQKWYIF